MQREEPTVFTDASNHVEKQNIDTTKTPTVATAASNHNSNGSKSNSHVVGNTTAKRSSKDGKGDSQSPSYSVLNAIGPCPPHHMMVISASDFRSWTCSVAGQSLTFIGFSRAGWSTGFFIPELGWCLDAGIDANWKPSHVFITHSHSDHADKIPYLWGHGMEPPIFYGPIEAEPFLRNYALTFQQLNDCKTDVHPMSNARRATFVGLKHGQEVKIERGAAKHQQFLVKAVAGHHRVPERAYLFNQVRQKLKTEYRSLPGKDIAKLRTEKGDAVMYEQQIMPMFAYLGDTLIDIFTTSPEILDYPVVITECTFLDPEHAQLALNAMHICWTGIEPIIASHAHITFILMHFSPRYTNAHITEFFERVTESGAKYKNMRTWI